MVKAHSSALYKVKPLTVNLIATGDEDGTVKLWDNRMKTSNRDISLYVPYVYHSIVSYWFKLLYLILRFENFQIYNIIKCNFIQGDDGNASWGSVMESKKFDEFVSDIYFDANVDDKIMVASSGEGNY